MGPNYVQQRLHFALNQAIASRSYAEARQHLDIGAPPASPNEATTDSSKVLTILQYAVEQNNRSIVKQLINASADLNTPPHLLGGRTALQLAASKGYTDMVKLLVDAGADVCGLLLHLMAGRPSKLLLSKVIRQL
ncbi:hypothetical protein EK21DRAFT_107020 [Setomelanomma holmii]|uniref:Ankyrin n=1 Tax=Setomelanomma holmii TaxID=210430 RepID=A0A9P4HJN6_9PLEO|nr:hypothetical protein EK21DRAFT_107020 [Setomelanomma holmii]